MLVNKMKDKFDNVYDMYKKQEIDYDALKKKFEELKRENEQLLFQLKFSGKPGGGNSLGDLEVQRLQNRIKELELEIQMSSGKNKVSGE